MIPLLAALAGGCDEKIKGAAGGSGSGAAGGGAGSGGAGSGGAGMGGAGSGGAGSGGAGMGGAGMGGAGSGGAGSGGAGSGGMPAVPTLGAQIDRMGRAGVNTALVALAESSGTTAMPGSRATKRDSYNGTSDPAMWGPMWKAEIAKNVAILDGLDTMCGNQLLAGGTTMGAYDTLAGALADDRLYLDSRRMSCTQYLAVEANATNVVPNMDCGGRTPNYDTIDTTYSVLAIGALTGVDDGVAANSGMHSLTAFPFLAAPTP